MPSLSQTMIAATVGLLALHTALTARMPPPLMPGLAAIRFDKPAASSFTEAEAHVMPRLNYTTAEYRQNGGEECFVTRAENHVHVYCRNAAIEADALPAPRDRSPYWNASNGE